MKKIYNLLTYIRPKDFIAPFIFLIAFPISIIFRIYNKIIKRDIWLICESRTTARDNGYHFFKYMRTKHTNEHCFYAIDKNCNDYKKIKQYDNIIQFGSFKHWIYYMSAKYNISNQKGSNPNTILFYFIHVVLGLYNNRVFLQHGIILNDCKWLYYNVTKFRCFICGSQKEYNEISNNYGYPNGNVFYTGLARFDNLYNNDVNNRQILVMPTWRNWLGRDTNSLTKKVDFCDTEYFKKWNSLLNNKKLVDYLEKNNIELLFYPHLNMQQFINRFKIKSDNIKLLDLTVDIQSVLKTSALMVTDYSSVSVDFAYMEKPLIYYQFDKKEYRKKQYKEGYFSYENDGFGEVLESCEGVVDKIIYYINNNYMIESKYLKRMKNFYPLHDRNNCDRIYQVIKEMR